VSNSGSRRLNGWQRLWVVASGLAFIAVCIPAALVSSDILKALIWSLAATVLLSASLYAVGRLGVWVMHGFRQPTPTSSVGAQASRHAPVVSSPTLDSPHVIPSARWDVEELARRIATRSSTMINFVLGSEFVPAYEARMGPYPCELTASLLWEPLIVAAVISHRTVREYLPSTEVGEYVPNFNRTVCSLATVNFPPEHDDAMWSNLQSLRDEYTALFETRRDQYEPSLHSAALTRHLLGASLEADFSDFGLTAPKDLIASYVDLVWSEIHTAIANGCSDSDT